MTGGEASAFGVADWRRVLPNSPQGASLGELAVSARERIGSGTIVFQGESRTTGDLLDSSWRLAGGLVDVGARRGDRVAVCMANCPEVLMTYHAIWRIGAVATPLMFLLSAAEIRHALRDSGATVIVTTADLAERVARASAGLPLRLVVLGDHDDSSHDFTALADHPPAPLAPIEPSELAVLLYTGGTTGRSKGVMLSHDAVSTAAWGGLLPGLADDLRTSLLPLPLAHSFGLTVATRALHAPTPTTTVLMPWFEPEEWLTLVERHGVDFAHLVPAMVRRLLAEPLESRSLGTLRRVISGSAPLPGEVTREWDRRVPGVTIIEGYGCSEVCAIATTAPTGRVKHGSVGPAVPGTELRIIDRDGQILPPGGVGEITIRSGAVMQGYWQDPETTAFALRDGWLHTGDVGRLDEDGYLYVVDRMKDVIIRSGFNVYPRDVESVLARHPAVAACAVVGHTDDRVGEEVLAFVQLREHAHLTEAELIAYARERLSAIKYPRHVRFVAALPLTSIGKVDRKMLRSLTHDPTDLEGH
jgi:long-chain acyl-CoA synthetase